MIRIKSKHAGFRRCAIAHTTEWKQYPDDRFNENQVKALNADPMLTVERGGEGKWESIPKEKRVASAATKPPVKAKTEKGGK